MRLGVVERCRMDDYISLFLDGAVTFWSIFVLIIGSRVIKCAYCTCTALFNPLVD